MRSAVLGYKQGELGEAQPSLRRWAGAVTFGSWGGHGGSRDFPPQPHSEPEWEDTSHPQLLGIQTLEHTPLQEEEEGSISTQARRQPFTFSSPQRAAKYLFRKQNTFFPE